MRLQMRSSTGCAAGSNSTEAEVRYEFTCSTNVGGHARRQTASQRGRKPAKRMLSLQTCTNNNKIVNRKEHLQGTHVMLYLSLPPACVPARLPARLHTHARLPSLPYPALPARLPCSAYLVVEPAGGRLPAALHQTDHSRGLALAASQRARERGSWAREGRKQVSKRHTRQGFSREYVRLDCANTDNIARQTLPSVAAAYL